MRSTDNNNVIFRRRAAAAAFLILLIPGLLHASPPRSRGARPIALGTAYSAVSNDPYSLYYNPAGLYEINQQQFAGDVGRYYSVNEPSGTDFNAVYAMPYRWRDIPIPLAMGLYVERPAPSAHLVDISLGGGTDAPMDRWTKGLIKFPVKIGAAATLRQQHGNDASDRIGEASLDLGFTGGLLIPINKRNQVGITLNNIFLRRSDTDGPSLHVGAFRQHTELINLFGDVEYGNKGIWAVHPGIEWMFARGVLRPRLGWGFHDNGDIDLVATGIGFNVSPVQIDIAYLFPIKSINDNAGQFRASLIYRFGQPQFSEIYYDRALEQANKLDQRVLNLTVKEAEMKASLAEAEQKRRMAQEETKALKDRIEALKKEDVIGEKDATIRDLRARIRVLEGGLSSTRNENRELREKKATVRVHIVQAGDTLQSLAREYYGDPNQWKKIYNANPDKIERGLPRIGEKLIIP